MKAGRLHDVLAATDSYMTEIGDGGQLAEEAAGLEVEALCRLGAEAAPSKLAAFAQRWPRSAQRARLAAACTSAQQQGSGH